MNVSRHITKLSCHKVKKQKNKEQKIKKNNQNLQFQNNYRQYHLFISNNIQTYISIY